MHYIIIVWLLIGLLTRLVDDYNDKKLRINKILIIAFAVLYGLLIALAAVTIPQTISLVLAVIVGLVIARKIDYYGHALGIIVFLIASYVFGFSYLTRFDPVLFVAFLFVAILDEIVSEYEKGFVGKILSHRPLLEVTAFLVSLLTGTWEIWIMLLLYDIGAGYVPIHKLFKKACNMV